MSDKLEPNLISRYGLRDGQPLVRAESGATTWTGKLPATQDYVVNVVPVGARSATSVIPAVANGEQGLTQIERAMVKGHVMECLLQAAFE